MELPKGVALVRVQRASGERVVLVSGCLSESQATAAKILAASIAAGGTPYVLLSVTDVLAVLHDAA